MKYMVLIFGEDLTDAEAYQQDMQSVMAAYMAYGEILRKGNHEVSSEALQPSNTATTIRVRNGKTVMTDGPFVESKEQVGGFYLIEAKDLDEALKLAALCPGAMDGAVEVRPCVDFSQMG